MQIISKFQDYYDHFSTIYGVEKKFVFNRTAPLPKAVSVRLFNPFFDRVFHWSRPTHRLRILVVCGKAFLIQSFMSYTGKPDILITEPSDNPEVWLRLFKLKGRRRFSFYDTYTPNYEDVFEVRLDELVALSKKVGSPIFIIHALSSDKNQSRIIHLESAVPNLSQLKLARLYSGEQLYQDVEYFICNILNESPDANPPVQLDDQAKIEKHGFDLKKSFRHRK